MHIVAGCPAMDVEGEAPTSKRRHTVGCALAPKKRGSFIRPSLLALATSRGIDIVAIDPDRPLSEQGPFDAVIHKLPGDASWRSRLREFSHRNPSVPVFDDPDDIDRLRNRISMLQVVSDLRVRHHHHRRKETFGIPRQLAAYDAASLTGADLRFPVVAKPLVADGSARSHRMALVFERKALARLRPPVVLQEFVNHGGVVFKVYAVGDHVSCVRRKSLPDVTEEERLRCAEEGRSVVPFAQVSNVTGEWKEEYYRKMQLEEDVEMPPTELVVEIARALREELRMQLFNFDLIRDVKVGNHYLVIDINYFPGYAKMPRYEAVLTDFFCDIVRKRRDTGEVGRGEE